MNEEYVKNYDSWNQRKKDLDSKKFDGFFHEREVWWCALGVNIGSEQDGKNENFERPVLIVKKTMTEMLLIVPLTSKVDDYEYRVTAYIAGQKSQILVSQVRVISNKRLLRRIGRVKNTTFQEIVISLIKFIISYKSETPF